MVTVAPTARSNVASGEDRGFHRLQSTNLKLMPDISVIIVTRNTRDLTQSAVASVFAKSDDLQIEIIVVDNGSVDGTADLLRANFPGIRCLRSETNLGFAKAVNRAAQESTGEFLLLLNSDAVLLPGALGAAIDWMRAHPQCGVAGAQLLNADGSRQNSVANFPTVATELLNKSLLRRFLPHRYPGKEQFFDSPLEVETVIGAFMLIRRQAWDSIGGLDERYFFFVEETDFCLQARRRGWRVMHLPQVLVGHGRGQSAKQVLPAARVEYWRSRYAFFAKNRSMFSRAALRVGLGIRLVFNWVFALLAFVVSLGRSERCRNRLEICSLLLRWHLCGCPDSIGLPR